MNLLQKIALQLTRSPTQSYNEALSRFRSGQRATKPYPGDFGLAGLKMSPLHRAPSPKEIPPMLPQQRSAVDFVMKHDGQGILAHMTGAGKTRSAVESFEALRRAGKAHRALVIAPAGLRTNFAVEGVHRFTGSKASILGGHGEAGSHHWTEPDPQADYHIVSYDLFRQHPEEILKSTGADTMILDEFHRVKDPTRTTFQNIARVRPLVRNVIGLTGSVISTHPTNILQPINVVTGGKHELGTQEQFTQRYLKEQEIQPKRKKKQNWFQWFFPGKPKRKPKTEIVGWQNTAELAEKLHKYVHYVGPQSVSGQMPRKVVETVRVEMSPLQEHVYRAALKELPPPIIRKIQTGEAMAPEEEGMVFNRVVKARQAANSIHTFTGVPLEEASQGTPKLHKMLDDLEDHLHRTPDGQVAVYTNLVHGGTDIIRAGLQQRGIPHGVFIGKGNEGITEQSRQQDVEDFKAGKTKVLVLSGAGNEGVSLPNATAFYAYDGHFNPEKVLQAEARAVRSGGQLHRKPEDRKVEVKRYMTVWPESRSLMGRLHAYFKGQRASDAVDEWIYHRAEKRHNINQQLYDVLQGQQPVEHSLFPEGGERPAAMPVDLHGFAPTTGAPPAPRPQQGSWWPFWKTSALEPELEEEMEKLAAKKGQVMSAIVKTPDLYPHIARIKAEIKKRIPGLEDSRGPHHVTLFYSHGLEDAKHPKLVEGVAKAISGKSITMQVGKPKAWENEEGQAVVHLEVHSPDLHHLHRRTGTVLKQHGGKETYPVYKPHLTLFYRDKPLTLREKEELNRVLAPPRVIQRNRSHIDVTMKTPKGWTKLAGEELEKIAHVSVERARHFYDSPVGRLLARHLQRAGGQVAVRQQGDHQEPAFRRYEPGTKRPLRVSSHPDVRRLAHQHAVEFHQVVGPRTTRVWVDIDPTPTFGFARAKMVSDMVHDAVKAMPEVKKTTVRYSGNRGFYVEGELHSPTSTDAMRDRLKKVLEPVLAADPKTTLGPAPEGHLRLDVTTLKNTGSIKAPYSLDHRTGLVSTPVSDLSRFEKKDATIEEVLGSTNVRRTKLAEKVLPLPYPAKRHRDVKKEQKPACELPNSLEWDRKYHVFIDPTRRSAQ